MKLTYKSLLILSIILLAPQVRVLGNNTAYTTVPFSIDPSIDINPADIIQLIIRDQGNGILSFDFTIKDAPHALDAVVPIHQGKLEAPPAMNQGEIIVHNFSNQVSDIIYIRVSQDLSPITGETILCYYIYDGQGNCIPVW